MGTVMKRVTGAIGGLIYAAGYGFFCAMSTGGGHVNLIWFILFFGAYFAGLFFVLAGMLVVDLSPIWAKIAMGVLLSLNWFMTIYFTLNSLETFTLDMTTSWNRQPIGLIVTSFLYFLPPLSLSAILLKKIIQSVMTQKYR